MDKLFLVEATDVFGEVYHLGIFTDEPEAEQAVERINQYAEYRQEGVDAPANLIPEQLRTGVANPILWEQAWVLPLPVCHKLEDCDLY